MVIGVGAARFSPNCCAHIWIKRNTYSLKETVQISFGALWSGQQLSVDHAANDQWAILSEAVKFIRQKRRGEGMVVNQGKDIGINGSNQDLLLASDCDSS